jgi:hypothetical protein
MLLVFFLVTLVAVLGLGYAWVLTVREMRAPDTSPTRKTLAWVSVIAVTAQALLIGAIYLLFSTNHPAIGRIAVVEVVLFLVAVPSAILRKGFARWWLILCSLYFLVFAGFVWVVSGIQF